MCSCDVSKICTKEDDNTKHFADSKKVMLMTTSDWFDLDFLSYKDYYERKSANASAAIF